MKKQIFKATALILIAGIALSSCKKSSSTSAGKLSYKMGAVNTGTVKTASMAPIALSSSTRLSAVAGTSPTNVTWTTGYAYISEIEFDALQAGTNIKYESKGLKKVDIFSPTTVLFNDVTLTAGVYEKIHLEVTIGNTSVTKEPGISLTGTYGTTPIQFAYDESQDAFGLTVQGNNFTFDPAKNYSGMINLHLNILLNGVANADLDAAVKNANGVIVINSTTNASIYQKAKQNLQNLSDVDFNN